MPQQLEIAGGFSFPSSQFIIYCVSASGEYIIKIILLNYSQLAFYKGMFIDYEN